MEKACKNQMLIDAIGEPIVRGPWYNASLAVAHKRHSVSCSFPVSGPQGTGIFRLKAVSNGGWYFSLHSVYFLHQSHYLLQYVFGRYGYIRIQRKRISITSIDTWTRYKNRKKEKEKSIK